MEYFGEGSEHTSSPDCKDELKDDLENLAECSSEFNCKCQVKTLFVICFFYLQYFYRIQEIILLLV